MLSDLSKTFNVPGTNSILEFLVWPSFSFLTLSNAGALEA